MRHGARSPHGLQPRGAAGCFGMMFASMAEAKTSALECTWVKFYDLSRSLTPSGPVWFERPARYTRAYSRLLIPSARNQNPSNEGGGPWPRPARRAAGAGRRNLRIRG
jgi:hypothetical protein